VVTVRRLSGGRVELTWPSVGGRQYRIERSASVSGVYTTIADDVPGDAPVNTWIDEAAPDQTAIYRVLVK